MILHRQGTQPRLIDSSEHSSINLNLRKRNSIFRRRVRVRLVLHGPRSRNIHTRTYALRLHAPQIRMANDSFHPWRKAFCSPPTCATGRPPSTSLHTSPVR